MHQIHQDMKIRQVRQRDSSDYLVLYKRGPSDFDGDWRLFRCEEKGIGSVFRFGAELGTTDQPVYGIGEYPMHGAKRLPGPYTLAEAIVREFKSMTGPKWRWHYTTRPWEQFKLALREALRSYRIHMDKLPTAFSMKIVTQDLTEANLTLSELAHSIASAIDPYSYSGAEFKVELNEVGVDCVWDFTWNAREGAVAYSLDSDGKGGEIHIHLREVRY